MIGPFQGGSSGIFGSVYKIWVLFIENGKKVTCWLNIPVQTNHDAVFKLFLSARVLLATL